MTYHVNAIRVQAVGSVFAFALGRYLRRHNDALLHVLHRKLKGHVHLVVDVVGVFGPFEVHRGHSGHGGVLFHLVVGRLGHDQSHGNVANGPQFLSTQTESIYGADVRKRMNTYVICKIVCGVDGVKVVLHALDQTLVEAEAVVVVAHHQRLQDEPEALLHALQLNFVVGCPELGIVRQHGHGKHQHEVGHQVRKLVQSPLHSYK
jgi:hypothetical protein